MNSDDIASWPVGLRRTVHNVKLITRTHYQAYSEDGEVTIWRYQFRERSSGKFIVYSGCLQGLNVVPDWKGSIKGTVKRQETKFFTTRLSRIRLYELTDGEYTLGL